MSETNPLKVELDQIEARIKAAASDSESDLLKRQFAERIAHLKERLKK